jgi:hypothetical protein
MKLEEAMKMEIVK